MQSREIWIVLPATFLIGKGSAMFLYQEHVVGRWLGWMVGVQTTGLTLKGCVHILSPASR